MQNVIQYEDTIEIDGRTLRNCYDKSKRDGMNYVVNTSATMSCMALGA